MKCASALSHPHAEGWAFKPIHLAAQRQRFDGHESAALALCVHNMDFMYAARIHKTPCVESFWAAIRGLGGESRERESHACGSTISSQGEP